MKRHHSTGAWSRWLTRALLAATAVGFVLTNNQAEASAIISHFDRGSFVNPGTPFATDSTGFKAGGVVGSGDIYQIRAGNAGLATFPPFDDTPVEESRNYHTFDLSTYTGGPVASATFRIWADVGAYDSTAASETIGLFDVSASAMILQDPSLDLTAAALVFEDLGNGPAYEPGLPFDSSTSVNPLTPTYGTFTVSTADDNSYIEVGLNAAAVADINASLAGSGFFSVGGALISIDGTFNPGNISERVFKNDSGTSIEPPAQLVLTSIPEPSALAFALVAVLFCVVSSRIHASEPRANRRTAIPVDKM